MFSSRLGDHATAANTSKVKWLIKEPNSLFFVIVKSLLHRDTLRRHGVSQRDLGEPFLFFVISTVQPIIDHYTDGLFLLK